MIRITVEDLETGEQEQTEIENDYVIITAGDYFLDGIVSYRNGTVVLTVKKGKREQ